MPSTRSFSQLLPVLLMFFSSSLLHAQAKRSYTGSRAFFIYENVTYQVSSILQNDTLIGGRIVYTGSITTTAVLGSTNILAKLQQAGLKNTGTSIGIGTADFDYKVREIQTFPDAVISSIRFSPLDGGSKDVLAITINFTAQSRQVSTSDNISRNNAPVKTKAMLASNFRVTLGNLPANRIATVEGLSLISPSSVRISVSQADEDAWKQMFYSGNGTKLQGAIELLAPDMREVVMRIELKDVELVGCSRELISGSEKIARIELSLRPRQAIVAAN